MIFQDDNGNYIVTGSSFAMTKQAISIFESEIKGDVSVNFKVDSNAETRKTLGYYGPQMNAQVAFTRQVFSRLDDSGNTLDKGYIVIQSDLGASLDCFYISGNSNWINLMTRLITDLTWDDYAVQITKANVLAKASATTGITFPYVDWAYNLKGGYNVKYLFGLYLGSVDKRTVDSTNNPDVSFQDFYPCLFLSSLIQEAFVQNGIKISGDVLNDALFKSLVIPPVSGQMKRVPFRTFTAYGSSQSFLLFGPFKYTSFTTVSDPDSAFSVGSNSFTVKKKLAYHFTATCNSITSPSSATPITYSVYKNGVVIPGSAATFTLYPGQSIRTLYPIPLLVGDVIEVYLSSAVVVNVSNPTGAWTATVNLKIDSPEAIYTNDYVDPSNFLPKLTCLDIAKFVVVYFGCVCYYDEYSKTLAVNIIDNIKKENALDWSEYYVSHKSEYTVQQAKNNYLKLEDPDESDLQKYNSKNKVGFGEGNITTGNTLKIDNDLLKIPFAASSFGIDYAGVWQANIPLVNLTDTGEPIPYTGITDLGSGQSRFAVSVLFNQYEVIRIVDNNGTSLGYYQIFVPSAAYFDLLFKFTSSFSGTILRQTIKYNEIKPRILSCKQTSFSDYASASGSGYSNKSGFAFPDTGSVYTTETNTSFAIFNKYKTNEPIDGWQANCGFDNPNVTTFKDQTIIERYFNKISSILGNPTVRFEMIIPKAVYQSFDFSQFIYVKTPKITGYFSVQSITHYVDGKTPVEVNCYML